MPCIEDIAANRIPVAPMNNLVPANFAFYGDVEISRGAILNCEAVLGT